MGHLHEVSEDGDVCDNVAPVAQRTVTAALLTCATICEATRTPQCLALGCDMGLLNVEAVVHHVSPHAVPVSSCAAHATTLMHLSPRMFLASVRLRVRVRVRVRCVRVRVKV